MANKTPILVTGTFTPSGTTNVDIIASIPLTVLQGTSPWIVSGTVAVSNFPASQVVTQGTSPWIISGTVAATQSGIWTTGRTWTLASGTDSIASIQSGAWTVAVNNFPATQPVSGTVTALQGTSPWVVSGTIAATQSGTWNINNISGTVSLPTGAATETTLLAAKVDLDKFTFTAARLLVDGSGVTQPISGTVTANQGTPPWVISGTVTANAGTNLNTSLLALDSTLTNATQKTKIVDTGGTNVASVSATGAVKVDGSAVTQPISAVSLPLPTGASTAALQTQPGVDIGDVTVNNGAGAAAVNIQDGGNSITVDGTITANAGTGTFQENITQFGGSNIVTGTGASGSGIPRVTVSNDSNILATQSGTWTVQPGNTPNTSPWLIEQRAPGTLTTYSAAVLGLVAAATPTDIFTIYGSGTKTIRILRIEISATENTSAIRDIILVKRSTANTGGTSAAVTAVPHDSNNAAATATVLSYTANPAALGTSVGNFRTAKLDISATNLVGSTDNLTWTFADRPGQAIVLRGTSQGIAINLNSVTSASSSFDISIEWSED